MTRNEIFFTTPYYMTEKVNDFLDTLSSDLMDVCIARDVMNHYDEEGTEVLNTERAVILHFETELTNLLKSYLKVDDENFDLHVVEIDRNFYLVDDGNNVYYDTEESDSSKSWRRFAIMRYLCGTYLKIEERIKEDKKRSASITVHDKYGYLTVSNVRKIPVRAIKEVYKRAEETVIKYMDFGELESVVTDETFEEVNELIRKAEEN